jgi:hypothetical protein
MYNAIVKKKKKLELGMAKSSNVEWTLVQHKKRSLMLFETCSNLQVPYKDSSSRKNYR